MLVSGFVECFSKVFLKAGLESERERER